MRTGSKYADLGPCACSAPPTPIAALLLAVSGKWKYRKPLYFINNFIFSVADDVRKQLSILYSKRQRCFWKKYIPSVLNIYRVLNKINLQKNKKYLNFSYTGTELNRIFEKICPSTIFFFFTKRFQKTKLSFLQKIFLWPLFNRGNK